MSDNPNNPAAVSDHEALDYAARLKADEAARADLPQDTGEAQTVAIETAMREDAEKLEADEAARAALPAGADTTAADATVAADRTKLDQDQATAELEPGATEVVTTLTEPGTALHVDDVRAFQTVLVDGAPVPVDATHTLGLFVDGIPYVCSGVTIDAPNVSRSAPDGISGTLTLTAPVKVRDGTAGNPVLTAHGHEPSEHDLHRVTVRARFDNIRAALVHGENGDHRSLAAAVRSLVDLLDEHL